MNWKKSFTQYSYGSSFCPVQRVRTQNKFGSAPLERHSFGAKHPPYPSGRNTNCSLQRVSSTNKIVWKQDVSSLNLPFSKDPLWEDKKFFNQCFDKGRLKNFVLWFLLNYGEHKTVKLVEELKNVGFEYASKAGISLGIDDLKIPPRKADLIYDAEKQSLLTVNQYVRGEITGVERFQRLIDTWHRTSEILKQEVIDYFEATDILNPVYMMAFSGARGNVSQVRQLVGMRGLMADPQGQIIDFPIRSNFREGLTLTEYIISSYGARKGIVDTALRTANAGYLTRRLVDVAQHVIISNFDCGTRRGIFLINMKDGNKTIHSVSQRIVGRILARDLFLTPTASYGKKEGLNKNQAMNTPDSSFVTSVEELLARRNTEVTLDLAFEIGKHFDKVFVRSALTCETSNLICQLCYGWSLAQGNLVSIGEAVGVVAAQSIGEPGTQLTMRTFHTGGVFSGDISDQIRAPFNGIVEYLSAIPGTLIRTPEGKIAFLTKSEGSFIILPQLFDSSSLSSKRMQSIVAHSASKGQIEKKDNLKRYKIPPFTLLYIRNGQAVFEKEVIAQISTISRKGNATDHAELTIKSEYEGQFYSKSLGFREKYIGPRIKINPDNPQTDNSSETNLSANTQGVQIEKVYEAWTWGYAWILSGKIYEANYQSQFFAQLGDSLNLQSCLIQTKWKLNESQKVFFNIPKQGLNDNTGTYNESKPDYSSSLGSKRMQSIVAHSASKGQKMQNLKSTLNVFNSAKNNLGLVATQNPILNLDLKKILFKKQGYSFELPEKSQFLTMMDLNNHSKANDQMKSSKDFIFFMKGLKSTSSTLDKESPFILQWFPQKTQTYTGGYFFIEDNSQYNEDIFNNEDNLGNEDLLLDTQEDINNLPKLDKTKNEFENLSPNPLTNFLSLSPSFGAQRFQRPKDQGNNKKVISNYSYITNMTSSQSLVNKIENGLDGALDKNLNSDFKEELKPSRILMVESSFLKLNNSNYSQNSTLNYIYVNKVKPLLIQSTRQGYYKKYSLLNNEKNLFIKLKTLSNKKKSTNNLKKIVPSFGRFPPSSVLKVPKVGLPVFGSSTKNTKKSNSYVLLQKESSPVYQKEKWTKLDFRKKNLFKLSTFNTLDTFCKTFSFIDFNQKNKISQKELTAGNPLDTKQNNKLALLNFSSKGSSSLSQRTLIEENIKAKLLSKKFKASSTSLVRKIYLLYKIFDSSSNSLLQNISVRKTAFKKSIHLNKIITKQVFFELFLSNYIKTFFLFSRKNKAEKGQLYLKEEDASHPSFGAERFQKTSNNTMPLDNILLSFTTLPKKIVFNPVYSLLRSKLDLQNKYSRNKKNSNSKVIGNLKTGWPIIVDNSLEPKLVNYHQKLIYPGQKNVFYLNAPIPIFTESIFIEEIFNINSIHSFSGLNSLKVKKEVLNNVPLNDNVLLSSKETISWVKNKNCRFNISNTKYSFSSLPSFDKEGHLEPSGPHRSKVKTGSKTRLALFCQPVLDFNLESNFELKENTYEKSTLQNDLKTSFAFPSVLKNTSQVPWKHFVPRCEASSLPKEGAKANRGVSFGEPLNFANTVNKDHSFTMHNCILYTKDSKNKRTFYKNSFNFQPYLSTGFIVNQSLDSLYNWKKYQNPFSNKQIKTTQPLTKYPPYDFSIISNPYLEKLIKNFNFEENAGFCLNKNQGKVFIPFVSRTPLNVGSYLITSKEFNDFSISYKVYSLAYPYLSQFDYSLYPSLFNSISSFLSFYLNKTMHQNLHPTLSSFGPSLVPKVDKGKNYQYISYETYLNNFNSKRFEVNKFNQKLNCLIPFMIESPCFSYKTHERLSLNSLNLNSNQMKKPLTLSNTSTTSFEYSNISFKGYQTHFTEKSQSKLGLALVSSLLKSSDCEADALSKGRMQSIVARSASKSLKEGKKGKIKQFRSKSQTSLSKFNYTFKSESTSSQFFATTNYYSPFNGEIVYTNYPPLKSPKSLNLTESNSLQSLMPTKSPGMPINLTDYSCMFLTKSDLISYYLPSKNFKEMIDQVYNEVNKNKYVIRDTLVKFLNMSHSNANETTLEYNLDPLFTLPLNNGQNVAGIKIAKLNAGTPLASNLSLIGDFFVYGDPISKTTAIQTSGQIIHYNNQKITLRRSQPIFISPKGLLRKFDGDFIDPKSPVITLSYQRLKTGDIIQGIPKVEQFFEARTTKRGRLFRDSLPSLLKGLFKRYQSKLPFDLAVRQSFYKIQQIVVDGVQRVYKSQGVTIADKNLEVIVKQMTSKVRILDGSQTGFFPGEVVDLSFVEKINIFLIKKITYEPLVLGITKASLEVDSFLSAASFQQTTRVLSKAAIYRKKDFLKGLKENVILGNLIPAGTGYLVYLDDF